MSSPSFSPVLWPPGIQSHRFSKFNNHVPADRLLLWCTLICPRLAPATHLAAILPIGLRVSLSVCIGSNTVSVIYNIPNYLFLLPCSLWENYGRSHLVITTPPRESSHLWICVTDRKFQTFSPHFKCSPASVFGRYNYNLSRIQVFLVKICPNTPPPTYQSSSVLLQLLAQLQCCPATQHFCNSAIIIHGLFMCNEFVITTFPFGPVLPSYFHLKAALAHMSSGVERLCYPLEIHMSCPIQLLSKPRCFNVFFNQSSYLYQCKLLVATVSTFQSPRGCLKVKYKYEKNLC